MSDSYSWRGTRIRTEINGVLRRKVGTGGYAESNGYPANGAETPTMRALAYRRCDGASSWAAFLRFAATGRWLSGLLNRTVSLSLLLWKYACDLWLSGDIR